MAFTAVLWLGAALLLLAQQASAEDMMLRDALTPDVLPVDPTQQMPTGLTLTRRPDGTLGLAEVPDAQKRPFKLQWYTQFDPSATQEFRDFVTGTIMPAAASLLGRFVRVRFPSGPLQFTGRVDEAGEPIPPGPLPDGAYDADVVVKVVTTAEDDPRCDGVIAFAQPRLFETLTRRPTFGLIQFCSIEPEFGFAINMQTVVHELLHVLGFNSALYGTYFGFEGGLFDVTAISPGSPTSVDYDYYDSLGAFPALGPAVYNLDFELGGVSPAAGPASPGLLEGLAPGPFDPYGSDNYYALFGAYDASPAPASGAPLQVLEYFYMEGGEPIRVRRPLLELLFGPAPEIGIITPNALREARLHFGCPEMETVLLQESFFGPTSHWNQRLYNGDVMRPSSSTRDVHFNRDAMTDLTLALLQDTGWYDVKYGSGGFNSYGYQGGCTFVNGTIDESLADPAAARYVCSLAEVGTTQCFHDFSGRGVCQGEFLLGYDDFYAVDVFADYTVDCQNTPGARCIEAATSEENPSCQLDMSCSPDGQVLVGGTPCASVTEGCPPDDFMCGDPGLLTCATPELNDCNMHGDCRSGRCFCHIGWGSADCSLQVCTTSCPNGSACPPSGFCGVPECGEWSVGDEGKGVPCTEN